MILPQGLPRVCSQDMGKGRMSAHTAARETSVPCRGTSPQHVGSQFPHQGSNLSPLYWKLEAVTTGPPRKFPYSLYWISQVPSGGGWLGAARASAPPDRLWTEGEGEAPKPQRCSPHSDGADLQVMPGAGGRLPLAEGR